ncbi:MAG: hypothetical protein NC131_06475 [Roseburia sp.]|nr:hypothetical protein [Roseburia sp.]
MKRTRKRKKYVYCIFYLEKKLYKDIARQLKNAGYDKLKAIVPMVKILRKTIKGKMQFVEEPVLFNYGFIKMPSEFAYDRQFLNQVKKKVPGIHHWLRDTETLHPRKKKARIDNAEDFDDFSLVATCPRKDVRRFLKISRENSQYSLDDFVKVTPGTFVQLKGYPYEGMNAKVKKVDHSTRTVELDMVTLMGGTLTLTLPFDNVIYSVYRNYDPDVIYASFLDMNPNDITEEGIQKVLSRKQY